MNRGDEYTKRRMNGRLGRLFYATWIPPRKIKDKKLILSNIKENDLILDVGHSVEPRRTFQNKISEKHVTLDINGDVNPDYVGNAKSFVDELKLNEHFDLVFSLGLLEHIEEPQKALDEFYRALKKGGKTIHWVPFIYRVHANYGDYWRFTIDGLKYLFRKYRNVRIMSDNGPFAVFARQYYLITAPLKDIAFLIRVLSFPFVWLFVQLDRLLPDKIKCLYCRGYFIIAEK